MPNLFFLKENKINNYVWILSKLLNINNIKKFKKSYEKNKTHNVPINWQNLQVISMQNNNDNKNNYILQKNLV